MDIKELEIFDSEKATKQEIENHFFRAGYSYAMLHLHIGLEKEKIKGLEKKLMKYLDFLNAEEEEKK